MSKSIRLIFVVLFICAVQPFAAQAQQGVGNGRIAQPNEIVGAWQLVPLPEDVRSRLNAVEPWPLKFQYFLIYRNGDIKWMMSSQSKGQMTSQRLRHILSQVPANKYRSRGNGFIEISYPTNPGHSEIWSVNIFTRRGSVGNWTFQPGDLLMSLDNGRGQAVYRRHLRRLR